MTSIKSLVVILKEFNFSRFASSRSRKQKKSGLYELPKIKIIMLNN